MIIEKYNADSIVITADKYEKTLGSLDASYDAWTEVKNIDITPQRVETSKYDLIFLGSPIWWYRPSVPLWTFALNNDFKDKDVILFNTFNSKFKQNYIDEFENIITSKGGRLKKHIYVRRGRWYEQLTSEELLEQFSRLLDKL